ncbi:hypothetical protein L3Q82_000672 [Scortum barcoo]|uniref:Uncharacterized protein n=1 Tax=Scortum barcoo TaxID=214431 RepID=A0ACB8WFS5_9TELE|nr:hypothetical protein L3Q82_000672 [Scortum barcoo]
MPTPRRHTTHSLFLPWAEPTTTLCTVLPVYKTLVHRQPAVTRTVKKWSEEAEEALKDCFNTTLWDVFSDAHGEDIDSLTHCLTDYINFCVENTVPTRTVRSFSNSKPWITPDIKALLKEKRRAFVSGNKEELKSVQRELRRMIRKGKNSYRRKMEHQLQQNNICGVWKGLKTISGFKEPKSQPVGDQGERDPSSVAVPQEHETRCPLTPVCTATGAHRPGDDNSPYDLRYPQVCVRLLRLCIAVKLFTTPRLPAADFVTGVPPSEGHTTILNTVDRFPNTSTNTVSYKRHLSTTSNIQTPNSTMAKTKELSKDTRNKIVDLHQAGKTESAIVIMNCFERIFLKHIKDIIPAGLDQY